MSKPIVIIGAGAAGLACAYQLQIAQQAGKLSKSLLLIEQSQRLGGHVATKSIDMGDQSYAIDTGFIVYNDRCYPRFSQLLATLNVPTQASCMSLSVQCPQDGIAYAPDRLRGLLPNMKLATNLTYLNMLRLILRFNRQAKAICAQQQKPVETVGDFLTRHGYSQAFIHHYLLPMSAAIWSAKPAHILSFSLDFFCDFFNNHGLLDLTDRPQWRVITHGSKCYVDAIAKTLAKDQIRLNCPIIQVKKQDDGYTLYTQDGQSILASEVILACHSDQAKHLLGKQHPYYASLDAIDYQPNAVTLHQDVSVMPKDRALWSSWNVASSPDQADQPVMVTYWMNRLSSLSASSPFLVSLNTHQSINEDLILGQYTYHHPQFDIRSKEVQNHLRSNQGNHGLWFCGAWMGNGFHEAAISSGLDVACQLIMHHA